MSKFKKISRISIIFFLIFSIAIFSGCSQTAGKGNNSNSANTGENLTGKSTDKEKLSIVCTIFPIYDWVRQILGDKSDGAELTLLLDNGVDIHNYQTTADDIVKISHSDLFLYVGGESDDWVDDVLASANNPNLVSFNLLESLGDAVREEETLEGMETEEGEEHEPDEHVWLSLKNAQSLCGNIADTLSKIDSANAAVYTKNAENYIQQLSALDQEYQAVTDAAKQKVLLFGDRFPFRYLADDYHLTCYAAFSGCSAETEASFETISFLAQKMDEFQLKTILTIEGSKTEIAKTIWQNSKAKDAKILKLDSMQSTTNTDIANGASYLKSMQANLEVLKEALA